MLNGMAFIRGDSPYYWNNFFPPNWSFLDVIPYLEKTESYHYPNGFYGPGNNFNYAANLRGQYGLLPVTSTDAAYGNGYTGLFIDKAKIVWPNIPAYKNNSLNNGFYPSHGVAPTDHSWSFIGGNKVRSDSYTTYIVTYTGSNLKSITHVRVNKILFSGTTVTGVELVFVDTALHASSSTCTVSTNTVISSGGQFATPQLLKLSGIGPRAELESFGIPVIIDNPYVGAGYSDQFQISLQARSTNTTTVPGPDYDNYGLLFWNIEDNPLAHDNFGINLVNTQAAGQTVAMFITSIGYTDSKGTVKLASANPDDIPIVDPNYLSTTRDKHNIAKAVNKTIQLIKEMSLQLNPDPCATSDCSTLDSLLNTLLLGGFGHPGNHMTGTCSMGKVVDPYTMKVYGTTGLYIIDATVVPEGPNENSKNTGYAVWERGIQFVIWDNKLNLQWLKREGHFSCKKN
eukprot:TRINITY_DN6535_c0_g1_i3.p1 TRINITY_DN6535_c0_g1~~TRINITY_DN6535_c0_g1_i3.p1  ORF type:complete len:456 (-),score=71.32 TRINITY_DN6535_c0_g1_i3:91-1458(-)